MRLAIAAQRTAGIVTEASAGNAGSSCSTVNDPPAMFDESYSVAALSCASNVCTDTLASFSSRGPVTVDGSNRVKPDIAAPGTSVRSASNGSDTSYASLQGTSMAGPHVAGAVALLLSGVPALSGDVNAIEARLSATAVRNATTSTSACSSTAGVYPNNLHGNGRLDVLCAVHGNLSTVNVGVAGSTTIGGASPCLGGTASVTDTGGGTATHQWGYRTTPGGSITSLPGQTGTTYQLNCANFPVIGTFYLVETTTPQCGSPMVSNETMVTVNSTPVELQSFQVE
jgi:subtilisin family serine protease